MLFLAGGLTGVANPSAPAGSGPELSSVALSEPEPGRAPSAGCFEKLPGSTTGIDLVHRFPAQAPFEMLVDQCSGNGVCAGDYDEDGLPDLFVTDYDRGNRLYRNLGDWKFRDVTREAGVEARNRWCTGAAFADVDNDGDLDLFVTVYNGPNLLYINQGNGTFIEQASAFGLDYVGASVMMAFGDYDRDGFLDGYLVTHRLNTAGQRLPRSSQEAFSRGVLRRREAGGAEVVPSRAEFFALLEKGPGRAELIIAGQPDRLYRNRSGRVFEDVAEAAGIAGWDIGLAATWWDYNQDGLPDLYVSNDYRGPDRLYRNDGNGAFAEVAARVLPHVPWASMGADTADINNDGYTDLLAADMAGSTHYRRQINSMDLAKESWFLENLLPHQYPRNAVYLGTGTEYVLEAAWLTGLAQTDWTWSPKFADLDNDGWVDLFLTTGMSRDFVNNDLAASFKERGTSWRNAPVLYQRNLAFRNRGGLHFEPAGGAWGLEDLSVSYGAAVADFDRDGDLDLVIANFEREISVYRNTSARQEGHGLLLRLRGTRSNSWGAGTRVRAETALGIQTRVLKLAGGFASADEPVLHFGLGRETRVKRLTLEWPSGQHQVFQDLEADRFYTVREPLLSIERPQPTPARPARFGPAEPVAGVRHQERAFDDFSREPLLPWKCSRFGPGLAIADVDGDGAEDFYLGGAAGQAGQLCLNDGSGHFRVSAQASFTADLECEDVGACFIDVDGDGDQDLYVVSGGVECEPSDPVLQDRLYLNDGRGRFTRAPQDALPRETEAGTAVASADFDRDGDLDLFVGGGSVPGQYPEAARSRLLINHRGSFSRAGPPIMSDDRLGVVTSALWSDADDDGWVDLLVTTHWGPVRFFRNVRGNLREETVEAGLGHYAGWWNGIAGCDLDGDGDIDYLVTNWGLNTRYQATPSAPAVLFRGIFEPGGPQLVEAYYEGGALLPLRGRSCLIAALPSLAARFPSHHAFASATLAEILTPEGLQAAERFAVNTLDSAVLLNEGGGRLRVRPLPRLAQMAPAFGVVAEDLDGDGYPDLCLGQNFQGAQPETGRLSGGLGLFLRGQGRADFEALMPGKSGVLWPYEVRSLGLADVNSDGWPDCILGVNDGPARVMMNLGGAARPRLSFRLEGKRGNPDAIGSRVEFLLRGGQRRTREIYAGGSYLTQSSARLYLVEDSGTLETVRVRWPDGTESTHPAPARVREWIIKQP